MTSSPKLLIIIGIAIFLSQLVAANNYPVDVFFTIPDTVYKINERIELKGQIYQANYTNNNSQVSASTLIANASINITMTGKDRTYVSNSTFISDNNGSFYSKSNFYPTEKEINASSTPGDYYVRATYIDPANKTWFSEVQISVVNETIDLIEVSPERAVYNPSESVLLQLEAIRVIADKILFTANVSINGSLRNETKGVLQNFSCTTGNDGKCQTSITAPSNYGDFVLELNNFKSFSSFSVVPFIANIYMKDELGQSLKNIYALGEQASIEVSVANASDSDIYDFSGYIADSSGNVLKTVNSTKLNNNNSFTNTFLFDVDSITFDYGAYSVSLNMNKTGDGELNISTSFQVEDWAMSINKRTANSGFEYEHSIFPNKTMNFEIYPTYRANGSLIPDINETSFTIQIKDNLNNILSTTNASLNTSCGNDGCYEFSLTSPSNTGEYALSTTLSHLGSSQTQSRIINVINTVLSLQSTNKDGELKELFGENEHVYLSLSSYNNSAAQINLSDAEVFLVSYMNGSEFAYTEVNYTDVNLTNSVYEWSWNSTIQRIKLDTPKYGGTYNIFVFGENRTVGSIGRFIINPYDICTVPKDTAGTVGTDNYYVWQFKSTDTIYFEIKAVQANNPLGRASAYNLSSNSSTHGLSTACNVSTATQQVVNNATITVLEVKNSQSGEVQNLNTTDTTCQSSDNSGGYSCTVKPLTKWEGGVNIVKFKIHGQDGTIDIDFGRFEARAFYMYGWSSTWQNSPTSNISLNVRLYEAGRGWWGSSTGLSGTITLKKVEYMGRAGEWVWPPVDSGYNSSAVSEASVTSGSGIITVPVSDYPGGSWKTGNYRALLQGTTTAGDTDYGYAWFGIKLWDVYAQPVECLTTGCNYKRYFNSKENITLYVKISPAGNYNHGYSGGEDISGNVTLKVKKIEDCKTWPCKELNSSQYTAGTLNLNQSSPWYWNANISKQGKYLLQINKTVGTGTWGTGYYQVILDINGTDTGRGWFHTVAFYVDTFPTNVNGSNSVYSIRGQSPMYFNITTAKNFKSGYSYGSSYIQYNESDYVNATFDDLVLRTWDRQLARSIEYNYPEDLNITPNNVSANALFNVTFNNGTWPTGWYWGEITLRNLENETSTGRLWFSVRPFRVRATTPTYNVDSSQCVNATINIFDSDWRTNNLYFGNYSITNIYENTWTGSSSSQTSYTNYTSGSFNATTNITVCPNDNNWGTGSWGGYHYLNLLVKDNVLNDTETGWLSFRSQPFKISWGSVTGGTSKKTSEIVNVSANITKYSSGMPTSANLTKIYQWRYDATFSGQETYVFRVGTCFSNVSGECTVNGTENITIYPNSRGWKVGYNYLQADWAEPDDSSSLIPDYYGIYIEGRNAYNGYFTNVDSSGSYKYNFEATDNLTIKLFIRNISYASVGANITNVQYALAGGNCWNEWCLSYTDATWSLIGGGNQTIGNATIQLKPPTGGWSYGDYKIKTTVSAIDGTATITGGQVRIKDLTAANMTINNPANNQTISNSTFLLNITTTENTQCRYTIQNYNNMNSTHCIGTAGNVTSTQKDEACNVTKYSYSGSTYYYQWLSENYRNVHNGTTSVYQNGITTGLITGETNHLHTVDVSNLTTQHYGIALFCEDSDDNQVFELVAFYVNITENSSLTIPQVTVNFPADNTTYGSSNIPLNINVTLDKNGSSVQYTLDGTSNLSMSTTNNRNYNASNSTIADGNYLLKIFANDTFGNKNYTANVSFTIDTTNPLISFGTNTPADGANLSQNYIYVNVSITESNVKNITFTLSNHSAIVNSTTISILNYTINWTNLVSSNYTYNVSILDKAGNFNTTSSRYVNLTAVNVPQVTIVFPENRTYGNTTYAPYKFNVTLNVNGTVRFSLEGGSSNFTMNTQDNREFNYTNISLEENTYKFQVYANDTSGNKNYTHSIVFSIDNTIPQISFGASAPADGANLTMNNIFLNITVFDLFSYPVSNVTYTLANNTAVINTTTLTPSDTNWTEINWTGLAYTNYTFNVSTFDLAYNFNTTLTRYVNLSAA